MCRPHCANLMRRFASQAGQTNVSPPRLHVLILLTGLAGSMQVLASTQQAKADSGLRVAALSSLRIFLQTTAAGAGDERAQHRWALACVGCIAPPAAAHAHALLGPDATQQLKQADIQARRSSSRCSSSLQTLPGYLQALNMYGTDSMADRAYNVS